MSAIPVAIRAGADAGVGAGAGEGAGSLLCERAKGTDPALAEALCRAVAEALVAEAGEKAGEKAALMLEITVARADLVAARWREAGGARPLVQMVAMDGPLQPNWPERMAADLIRALPP